jgi:hypothetical protein
MRPGWRVAGDCREQERTGAMSRGGDQLCSNFSLEGEPLVRQLGRPFRFLAKGFLSGEKENGGGGGRRTATALSLCGDRES